MDKTYIWPDVVYGHNMGPIVKHYKTYDEQDNKTSVKSSV